MNVFDLFAKLSLDSSEYDKGLDDAEKKANGFGSKFSNAMGVAARVGGATMLAVGTAAAATGKAFVDGTKEVAEYGDEIDKNSQKLGISAQAYQEWDAVLQHSGTSMSSMTSTFKTLSNAAQQTTDQQAAAFERLGLSLDEVSQMSTEDLFANVIYALQDMEEGTERTAIAADLLGRGAMEMGALLNTSAEDTQAMIDRVHELGGVMSDDAVKASAAYQDSLQDMGTALDGLKHNIMSEFLPGMTTVMDGLANVFSGDYDKGLDQISEGIDKLVTKLTDNMPKILELGVKIVESLAKSIVENLPKLMPTLVQMVTDIAAMLVENLPLLLNTGIQLITQLFVGIAEALPELLPTIIDAIIDSIPIVIDALVGALPQLIQGLITLVIGIVEALPVIIQSLIDALPTIITSIVNGLIEALPQLIEGCVTLVIELVKHLPEIILALIQAIPQIIMAIIEAFAPFVTQLAELFGKAVTAAIEWFKELPNKIAYWVGHTIGVVAGYLASLPQRIADFWANILDKIKEFFTNLNKTGKEKVEEFKSKIVDGLKALPEKVKEIGRNIVEGLKGGIKEKWDNMVEWFSNLGQGLIDGFKSTFGIHSPSKVFAKLGEYMAQGLGVGFDDRMKSIGHDMESSFGDVVGNMSGTINANVASQNNKQPIIIENRVVLEGDANTLFNKIAETNRIITQATGTNLLMA